MGIQTFARILRERRLALGLSQSRLAALLSVNPSTVSKWESMVSFPDILLLDEIAFTLQIPRAELLSARTVKETSSHGNDMFHGYLIKEALLDLSVLDLVTICDVRLQSRFFLGGKELRYVTCLEINTSDPSFPEVLASSVSERYVAELDGVSEGQTEHYLVCRGDVFRYRFDDAAKQNAIRAELKKRGLITEAKLNVFKIFGSNQGERP